MIHSILNSFFGDSNDDNDKNNNCNDNNDNDINTDNDDKSSFGRFKIPFSDSEKIQFLNQPTPTKDFLNSKFSILVWNVYKQRDSNFENVFKELCEKTDLLVLQEVHFTKESKQFYLNNSKHNFVLASQIIYNNDQSATGTAIGSVVEMKNFESQLTDGREPIIKTPKSSVLVLIDIMDKNENKQQLLVVSIHAINRGSNVDFENQLKLVGEKVAKHKGPVIVGGDFNTQSKVKRSIMNRLFEEQLKMKKVEFEKDLRTKSKLSRKILDHCFVRGLKQTNSKCFVGGSDHTAMKINFQF